MSTSQYTYHPFHTIGAAAVLLWDALAAGGSGAWLPLGRAADAALLTATEQVGKDLTLKGLTQPIARRNRSKRYTLAFRLLEDASPLTLDLLGDGAEQQAQAQDIAAFGEVTRLHGRDWRELAHPFGLLDAPAPPVTGLDAAAGGSGGSITPGAYFLWVVPLPVAGWRGQACGPATVTVTSGQQITLTFTAPAGYTPESYEVYWSGGATIQTARLGGSGTGSPIVLTTLPAGTQYVESSGAQVRVKHYSGSPSYVLGTDYELTVSKGLIRRSAAGAIPDGGRVVVEYLFWQPAGVATSLGDAVDLERYRRVKLLQLAAEGASPSLWRETGVEFTFYKVNVGAGDARWPFSEEAFSEGASVSWDCLYDAAEAKVGEARSTFGVLAEW